MNQPGPRLPHVKAEVLKTLAKLEREGNRPAEIVDALLMLSLDRGMALGSKEAMLRFLEGLTDRLRRDMSRAPKTH